MDGEKTLHLTLSRIRAKGKGRSRLTDNVKFHQMFYHVRKNTCIHLRKHWKIIIFGAESNELREKGK